MGEMRRKSEGERDVIGSRTTLSIPIPFASAPDLISTLCFGVAVRHELGESRKGILL